MKIGIVAVSVLALLSLIGCASQSQIEEQNNQLAATPPNSFEYTRDGQPISCQEYWKAVEGSYAESQPNAKAKGLDKQCASVN
ncbi:hypothetical protein [Pseudomonas chlororaphis]